MDHTNKKQNASRSTESLTLSFNEFFAGSSLLATLLGALMVQKIPFPTHREWTEKNAVYKQLRIFTQDQLQDFWTINSNEGWSSHSSKDLSYHRRTSEHPEKLPGNIYDCSTPERENATHNPLLFDILVISVSYVEVVPNDLQSRYVYIHQSISIYLCTILLENILYQLDPVKAPHFFYVKTTAGFGMQYINSSWLIICQAEP